MTSTTAHGPATDADATIDRRRAWSFVAAATLASAVALGTVASHGVLVAALVPLTIAGMGAGAVLIAVSSICRFGLGPAVGAMSDRFGLVSVGLASAAPRHRRGGRQRRQRRRGPASGPVAGLQRATAGAAGHVGAARGRRNRPAGGVVDGPPCGSAPGVGCGALLAPAALRRPSVATLLPRWRDRVGRRHRHARLPGALRGRTRLPAGTRGRAPRSQRCGRYRQQAAGLGAALAPLVVAHAYPQRLASVLGVLYTSPAIGGGLGPVLVGAWSATVPTRQVAWFLAGCLSVAAGVLRPLSPQPGRRIRVSSTALPSPACLSGGQR
jgi:hypothetical protein